MKKIFYNLIIIFSSLLISTPLGAQQVIEIEPLFEYPVAPEEIESLTERCDYLVKHFWDNFDFKQKNPVHQYALTEAFNVYVTSMRYASKKEADQSIDKLLGKISGNPSLLLQFAKAAEENLYGPRADIWSDDLYLKFVDALIKNKKISQQRKAKYLATAESLRQSSEGQIAPEFDFKDLMGETKIYFPMSTPTILIFGDPEDTEWRLMRLKMDTNFRFQDALDKGKINVLYIIPYDLKNWENSVSNYNSKWTLGQSSNVKEKYDIRVFPAVFIVGSDGKILKKLISPEEAVNTVLELVE